jgi:hypothetical protein
MQDTTKRTLNFIIACSAFFGSAYYFAPARSISVYDCNEITPDFPDAVIEECHIIKEKKWKQQKTLQTI